MNPSRHAVLALGLLAGAGSAAAQTELVWLQNPETYTQVDSAAWIAPPARDVEAADDFEFVGDVTRIIVSGDFSFQSPSPHSLYGVYVRFYAWDDGSPGALQHEVFVPSGDPGLLLNLPPEDIDVTLPLPFEATGLHFVSLQLVTEESHSWRWWNHKHGFAEHTTLASAHVRDNLAGGDWQVYETFAFDYEVDLAFELWGSDGDAPPDPVDPCGPWALLPTPPLPSNYGTTVLRDVLVIADDDAWAVGNPAVTQLGTTDSKNLALHWNGQQWQEVATPNPSVFPAPYGSTGLQAVDGLASDFVWLVGNQEKQDTHGFIVDQPLVLRWDGDSVEELDVPNTNFDTYTYGVKLLAPDDGWLVGGGVTPTRGGLAIHWDGSGFELVPTPGPGDGLPPGTPGYDLEKVDGVAGDDVWAVGGGSDGDFAGGSYVLHWDGSSWSHVPSPSPGFARRLFDVHALASDDVWAVGQYEQIVGMQVQFFAYAIHWDGSSWSLFDGAEHSVGSLSVHAFGPDDVYTAGGQIHHFDGSTWSVADDLGQLNGEAISVTVAGLDAVQPCGLFAAGRQVVAGRISPFTARQAGGGAAEPCEGYALSYGQGLGGENDHVPALYVTGCTDIGQEFVLSLDEAVGGAFGVLFAGTTPGALPFMGGTFLLGNVVVQQPVFLAGPAGFPGAGYLDVPLVLFDPSFAGIEICLQAAFVDEAAPYGVSITNGLRLAGF